jgi:hypothetical protein
LHAILRNNEQLCTDSYESQLSLAKKHCENSTFTFVLFIIIILLHLPSNTIEHLLLSPLYGLEFQTLCITSLLYLPIQPTLPLTLCSTVPGGSAGIHQEMHSKENAFPK